MERHNIAYGCVCRGRGSIIFVSQVNPQCNRTETNMSQFISEFPVTCCRNKKLELFDSKQGIEVYEREFLN